MDLADLMSYKDFAKRFPPEAKGADMVWVQLLNKWREDGKLIERTHWVYRRRDGSDLTRFYNPVKVIRLIVSEARSGKSRPRISYLYQQYLEEFVQILEAAASSASSVNGSKDNKAGV